jgi:hypothetical protein
MPTAAVTSGAVETVVATSVIRFGIRARPWTLEVS